MNIKFILLQNDIDIIVNIASKVTVLCIKGEKYYFGKRYLFMWVFLLLTLHYAKTTTILLLDTNQSYIHFQTYTFLKERGVCIYLPLDSIIV